jgi:hypothetical protein
MSYLQQLNTGTPTIDKGLTILGALVSGLTISDVSTGVGITVGIVTLSMITPRAVLNWQELRDANAKRRAEREKAKRAAEESDPEGPGY